MPLPAKSVAWRCRSRPKSLGCNASAADYASADFVVRSDAEGSLAALKLRNRSPRLRYFTPLSVPGRTVPTVSLRSHLRTEHSATVRMACVGLTAGKKSGDGFVEKPERAYSNNCWHKIVQFCVGGMIMSLVEIKAFKSPSLLFGQHTWVNMLILGDNLPILRLLKKRPDVSGQVRLIYIDPPFGTGQ